MRLKDSWYAVALSSDVKNKPVALKRFGKSIVLFRSAEGSLRALLDRCPHRSAKLSHGRIIEDSVECPFHGFRFGSDGSCAYAPEFHHSMPKLHVRTFEAFEKGGVIWLWSGDGPASQNKPEWFEQPLGKSSSTFREVWPCHISRCVENQLDYTHLPFVHRNSIGRFATIGAKPKISYEADKIHFSFEKPENKQFIEFRFPNVWINSISDRFCITLIFAPVDENHTELILTTHQSFIKIPGLSHLVNVILKVMNKKILHEDRRVVSAQEPTNSLIATDEHLYANDAIIRHYRDWWTS